MLTLGLISSFLCAVAGIGFLTWYALYAKKNNGGKWTASYSATYSLWYKKLQKKFVMWGLYCSATCFLYIWPAYVLSSGFWQSWIAVLSMMGIFVMGVFPSGKDSLQTKIHCAAVQVSIWSTLLWVVLHGLSYWWILPIAFVPTFLPWLINKKTKKIPDGLIVEWSAFSAAFLWLAVYSLTMLF